MKSYSNFNQYYCISFVFLVVPSRSVTNSNTKFSEIPKYLSSNLNLANKDMIIIFGKNQKFSNEAKESINGMDVIQP